jgi:hypothetical protein
MCWPNGSQYCGQYVNDSKHGTGTFTWPDGRSHRGEWREGKQHGQGVATDAQGTTIYGQWSKGQLVASKTNAKEKSDPKQHKSPRLEQTSRRRGRSGTPRA